MNSDHAPTAEEQLPPLDELAGAELHLGYSRDEAALRCRERQLLAALRENREKDARIAELEKSNAKVPKMYVWGTGRQGFYATAQAYSVAEARELLLEETGTTDGSCPIRALAIDAIRNENPTIFYRSNAQFTLTDSAELEEMDAYAETLRNRAEAAEAKLRAVSDALDETERADAYCPACGNSRVEGHVTNCFDNDWVLTEPDALFARLRAIVEGK